MLTFIIIITALVVLLMFVRGDTAARQSEEFWRWYEEVEANENMSEETKKKVLRGGLELYRRGEWR